MTAGFRAVCQPRFFRRVLSAVIESRYNFRFFRSHFTGWRFRSRSWRMELPGRKFLSRAAGKGFRTGLDRAFRGNAQSGQPAIIFSNKNLA